MAENSKIQWTHHTMNPWRGCTKISPGCTNCYAEAMSVRNPSVLGVWGDNGTRVVAAENYWRQPIKWNRDAEKAGERRRVFCASLADVFEDRPELVPWRQRLFHLIGRTTWLDWLLLTKRPENVERMGYDQELWYTQDGLPRNVWLGVSVEDQQRADERIPLLLTVPAAVRFISAEPLLGPVNMLQSDAFDDGEGGGVAYAIAGIEWDIGKPGVDWVIAGGESGGRARPCRVEWVRSIVEQCKAAGVACFVKQLGAHPIDESTRDFRANPAPGVHVSVKSLTSRLECHLIDKKGGDPDEWPEDLRIRQFPASVA